MQYLLGLGSHDVALLLIRIVMGTFFVGYRFRWFYDPSQESPWFSAYRKHKLTDRLCTCGYPSSPFMSALVATTECAAGLGLMVGLFTVPAAVAILVVMIFATLCTCKEEIPPMQPVDKIDCVACYLKLCEPLYITMALVVILSGPGWWSLDHLLHSYFTQ